MIPTKQMLQGWKEIADYVSRDERTVKRWEKQRRLPVRRMPGKGRANVYVLVSELDQWLQHGPGPAPEQPLPTTPTSLWFRPVALGLVLFSVAGAVLALREHRKSLSAASPAYAAVRYISRVPGVEDLTLRGVYFYEKRTPDSLSRAEQSLQQAVTKDPGYAPAWSALAITDLLIREYGSMPDVEAFSRARSEAQRAIALDPDLAEAHVSLAFVLYFWDEFPSAAEQEFQAALRLNPNSALAHQWYGSVLTHEGRFAEALQQLDTAQRLEPNSTAILATRAYALGLSGHREEAIEMLNAITEQDPNYSGAHFRISVLCGAPSADVPCSLRESRRWATLRHDDGRLGEVAAEERAYRSGGEAGRWRAVIQWEKARHHGNDIYLPVAEAALGRTDDALADLERLAANGHAGAEGGIMGINMQTQLRPLHADPRYQRIVASLGLPQVP
jgi:tetratricopeptide (TPR) repeat protein